MNVKIWIKKIKKLRKKDKEKIINYSTVILGVTSVILGYLIFLKYDLKSYKLNDLSFLPFNKPSVSQEISTPTIPKSPLDFPDRDAPQEEHKAFNNLVANLAEEAETLAISNCTGTPLVLRLNSGETIVVDNLDDVKHTLHIGPENSIVIPGDSKTIIEPDFSNGPGVYGYGCDQIPGAAGVFFVSK